MQKLIIYVGGKPLLDGYHKRDFKWSEEHQVFVFESRELELDDFNAVWERAFRTNADLVPRVRVVGKPDVVAAPEIKEIIKEVAVEKLVEREVYREPTLDEAIAIVAKQAPERLKKIAKPATQAVAIEV